MMLMRVTGFAVLLTAISAVGAGDLILNGDFAAKDRAWPPYWMPMMNGGSRTDYHRTGGPGGRGFIRLIGNRATARIQQNNLKLVGGGKYLLGAWIRTRGVGDKTSGIRVGRGSYPERGANSLDGFPADQPEWRHYEKLITVSADDKPLYPYYSVDIVLESGGEMDVAGVTLVPKSADAEKKSLSQMDNMTPCLVPLGNLHYLDRAGATLDFAWVGALPGRPEELECEFSFDADRKSVKTPFSVERFHVKFGSLSDAVRRMRVRVLERSGGKVRFEETFPVRAVAIPEPGPEKRKLNNLVTELFASEVKDGETVAISNDKYRFLLFRVEGVGDAPFELLLDGCRIADRTSLRNETIRDLEPGRYEVTLRGASGRLTVRAIPDVMTFALWTPRMPGNGRYDWAFAEKFILPGLTTINVAGADAKQFARLNFLGRKLLGNYGVQNWSRPNIPEDDLARMEEAEVFKDPLNHGSTMDESECWYPVMLDPYAWALKRFANPGNKLIVTYQTGPITPAYLNVISAAANASSGRAYLAFEVYPRGQRTPEELRNMLDMAALQWRIFRDNAPGLFDKAGMAWGNFSCPPNISLAHYPDVDYKYVLDMKMHSLANDPAYEGLGKVAFWGTHAADEEIVRWSFRLMRHYAFEGRREPLSARYGFTMNPGHVRNADFTAGLQHWRVSGSVRTESFPGYGKDSLRFHGSAGAGDAFALFERTADAHGELSQTLTGLRKGRTYLMYFYVGDYDDIINRRQRPGALPLEFRLDGVTVSEHVHYKGNNTKSTGAYVNIHKVKFVAGGDTAQLTFTNAAAAPGSRLALNYICVRPYFEVEETR